MPNKFRLLPTLSTEEREALTASIKKDGIRFPIFVDGEGEILDGHHREEIGKRLRVEVPRKVIRGLTGAEKIAFVYSENMHRRNLSPDQKKEIRKALKSLAGELKAEGKTQAQIGALLGQPRTTIEEWLDRTNDETVNSSKSNPDSRVKVSPKQYPLILERSEKGESQEQIAADYGITQRAVSTIINKERQLLEKKKRIETIAASLKVNENLILGDFREVGKSIPDASIPLILTDPPYGGEYIDLYSDLAELADRVLIPGGILLTYSGQSHLHQVIQNLGKNLIYLWCFAVRLSGAQRSVSGVKVYNGWKPVLAYYKPPLDSWWEAMEDFIHYPPEKEEHEWQQPLREAERFIDTFCPLRGVTLDPMCGSGTTLLAARNLGRRYIGIEIDTKTYEEARIRMNGEVS